MTGVKLLVPTSELVKQLKQFRLATSPVLALSLLHEKNECKNHQRQEGFRRAEADARTVAEAALQRTAQHRVDEDIRRRSEVAARTRVAAWLHAFVVIRRTGDTVPSPHPASGGDRTIPVPTEQGSVAVQPEVTVPAGTAGEPLLPDLTPSPRTRTLVSLFYLFPAVILCKSVTFRCSLWQVRLGGRGCVRHQRSQR